ncbi:MAG: helix-turn-helix transcriptional regulator [Actinobacteria bacterium]|nr:helix-turn-helix transcriptional regulator [Actinomycetota bacterium]
MASRSERDPLAYEEVIGRNVAAWRAIRKLSQKDLAARVSALGIGWYQQTVGSIERSERQVTTTEAVILALALETTVPALLTPAEPFCCAAGNVMLPSGGLLTVGDIHALVFNIRTHAVTWDGIWPVLEPGSDPQSLAETFCSDCGPLDRPGEHLAECRHAGG